MRYATQAAAHLQRRDIKLLVVACNTASAVAIEPLQQQLAPLPVIGVVEPGAAAAVDHCRGGRHLVLATEATVAHGAYRQAIQSLDSNAEVTEMACELLVALAEEGWTDGTVAESIVGKYLQALIENPATHPDTLILGCTHFPILRGAFDAVIDAKITVVDSASTTAAVVKQYLRDNDLLRDSGHGSLQLLATDGARRFARVGGAFLNTELQAGDIELVDL